MSRQSPRDEFRRIGARCFHLTGEFRTRRQELVDGVRFGSLLDRFENVFEHERLQDRGAPQGQLQSMNEIGSVCLAASFRKVVISKPQDKQLFQRE